MPDRSEIDGFEARARTEFAALSDDSLLQYLIAQTRVHPIEKLMNSDFQRYDRWIREEIAKRTGTIGAGIIGAVRFYRSYPQADGARGSLVPNVSDITAEQLGKSLVERFGNEDKPRAERPTMADVIDERGRQVLCVRVDGAGGYDVMPPID